MVMRPKSVAILSAAACALLVAVAPLRAEKLTVSPYGRIVGLLLGELDKPLDWSKIIDQSLLEQDLRRPS
jgi:hypothetical protein